MKAVCNPKPPNSMEGDVQTSLAEVWDPLLHPLPKRQPTQTPTTLMDHSQEQKPHQD
jgi:hypothetical protein